MGKFFHYDDIIKAMVSNEQKWQVWRAHTGAATQPQAWFWLEPDTKDPIQKIVKAWKSSSDSDQEARAEAVAPSSRNKK